MAHLIHNTAYYITATMEQWALLIIYKIISDMKEEILVATTNGSRISFVNAIFLASRFEIDD